MRERLAWIWRFWRDRVKVLPVLVLLTFLSTAVAVGYPLVFKFIIDEVIELAKSGRTAERSDIAGLVGLLLLVGAGRSLRNIYPMLRAWVNCLIRGS